MDNGFRSLLIVSGCQEQDTTEETPDAELAQGADSPEAKLAQAQAVAAELPALRPSIEALEAAVSGGADATPSQSDVDGILAGYDEEFRFDCSEGVLGAASREENVMRSSSPQRKEGLDKLQPIRGLTGSGTSADSETRGAPQRGLAVLIFRVRARSSGATAGRPGRRLRLFHVQ